MRPEPNEGADSCLVFVRTPGGIVRSIRHLPADPHARDMYGHIELATGLLSDFFKIVNSGSHSLGRGVGDSWASAATGDRYSKHATFLRIESIEDVTAGAVDSSAERFARLFAACHSGDLEALEEAFRTGCSPNGSSQYGNTLLHAACSEDQLAVVTLLLFMGADATAENWAGENPAATARRQGAKASERLLRQFSLSVASTSHGDTKTPAAALNDGHQAAGCRQQMPSVTSHLHLRTGGAKVDPVDMLAGAAAHHSPQSPSPQREMLHPLVSAIVTTANDDGNSLTVAVGAKAKAKTNASQNRSASPMDTVANERRASKAIAASHRPLIRHRRSCSCPRQSKIAGVLALVGDCSDSDADRIESESRRNSSVWRLLDGQPQKQGHLQRIPSHLLIKRLRRKSVTFVGLSPSDSDDDWHSDAQPSDISDDDSSHHGSDDDALSNGCSPRTRKSSKAFVKWLEKKQSDEKMTELWRRQSSTAAAQSAATALDRQRHGIFILACSESETGQRGMASGADPLNNARAYRRWVQKRERSSREPKDSSVLSTGRIRYPAPLLTYEEWLSMKSASTVPGETVPSVNESAEMLGRVRGLTHADWLEALSQRRAAADEQLRKKAQRDATTDSFCDWARTMGSRRKTFAEWCADKQRVAKLRAEAAQSAAIKSSPKCTADCYRRISPGARTFDSWLFAVEQRELGHRSAALMLERQRLRTVLDTPLGAPKSTDSEQLAL